MKVGDYVQKIKGYASESKILAEKSGLITQIIAPETPKEPQRIQVLTIEGFEIWALSFCEVIDEA